MHRFNSKVERVNLSSFCNFQPFASNNKGSNSNRKLRNCRVAKTLMSPYIVFIFEVFKDKFSESSFNIQRVWTRGLVLVCLCFSLPENLVANERRARGTGKRQTKNATLSWCRLRCLELARVHTNWLTLSHKLLLKVKSIKRRLIDFQSLRFLLNAAGIRSLIQDKDNPKKKTKSKT